VYEIYSRQSHPHRGTGKGKEINMICTCNHEWRDHEDKEELNGVVSTTFYGACHLCDCKALVAKVKDSI
jgi:putative NADPH-quinone reductase